MQKIARKLWGEIHQSYFVVAWCVGVIGGTILALVFRINYFGSAWWCVLAGLLLVVAYLKPKVVFMVVVFLAGMVMVFFRVSVELVGEDYIRGLYDAEVLVEGIISGDPETDEGVTNFKLTGLKFGEEKVETSGSIYVTSGKNEELKRGDKVVLEGKMGAGFGAYAGYMWRPKIAQHMRAEPGDLVVRIRDWFAERVRKLLPEEEAQLGLSYLLGMKTGLDDEFAEKLRTVGLTHIVVASGAHLAILVEVAKKLLGRVSRFAGLAGSVGFILFFMSMVGWTPSIMRAGVMAILTLMAWYVGRKIAPWRLSIIVAAFTLMVNPNFVTNMGWLLSFASYAGIMMVGPWATKFFYGRRKPGFVAGTILTTLAATVMTLPIILYYYGQVSLISVVANLLILPTLPYVMGLVFLTGACAGMLGVEMVVGWCAKIMLDFHMTVVGWLGEMRQFLIEIPPYQVVVFVITRLL